MEKKIGQYLHLYLGCQAICSTKDRPERKHTGKMVDVSTAGSNHSPWVHVAFETVEEVYRDDFRYGHSSSNMAHFFIESDEIKPILRPLRSITDEESDELGRQKHKYDTGHAPSHFVTDWAYKISWALSKGFDIFGLIAAGLAIDSTTLKRENATTA